MSRCLKWTTCKLSEYEEEHDGFEYLEKMFPTNEHWYALILIGYQGECENEDLIGSMTPYFMEIGEIVHTLYEPSLEVRIYYDGDKMEIEMVEAERILIFQVVRIKETQYGKRFEFDIRKDFE